MDKHRNTSLLLEATVVSWQSFFANFCSNSKCFARPCTSNEHMSVTADSISLVKGGGRNSKENGETKTMKNNLQT